MLKTRIMTGIMLIGMIFWSIFSLPSQAFIVIAGILSFCMMREWITLVGVTHRLARVLILDIFLVCQFLLVWTLPEILWIYLPATLFWVLVFPWLCSVQTKKATPRFKKTLWIILGYFTLLSFFASLVTLRQSPQGDVLVLLAFLIVWCSDSFAYAVGKLIGRHKLIPFVSPGKSWEGFIGASLLTIPCLIGYWVWIMEKPLPTWGWGLAMFTLICMALLGDLFESLLKRTYQVKDSGTLLPGHGGLLDRFDSLMAVAPVFAAFVVQGIL